MLVYSKNYLQMEQITHQRDQLWLFKWSTLNII